MSSRFYPFFVFCTALYGGLLNLKLKTAFDAFKIAGTKESDRSGLVNALSIVFYDLPKTEIEKIVEDIYAETNKSQDETTNVYEVLEFFEKHPEIANEKKPEFTRSSSASLPQHRC